MPFAQFDIVFRGLREGFPEAQVQVQFASLFKLDAAKTQRIFTAKKVTLKTNISEPLADKYIARLAAIGVLVDKLPVAPEFHITKAATPAASSIPGTSKAIYYHDHGEESCESSAMHQSVEFCYGPETRRIPFVFDAEPLDYVRLWFTNLLVCLLSAGLLWPWARARAQRFFYQRTSLDAVEFGYRSRISRVLLLQFALVIYLLGLVTCLFFKPIYALPALVLFVAILPIAIMKLHEFQLRNAFYGDHSWHYTASLKAVYIHFLLWPLAILATAGLAAPWALMQIQRHIVQSRRCGQINFSFSANWNDYLPLLLPILLADGLSLFVYYWNNHISFSAILMILVLAWLLVLTRWNLLLSNLYWNGIRCPLGYFIANRDLYECQKLWLRTGVYCLLTLGLYWPWAKIHWAQYKARHLAFFANRRYGKWKRALVKQQSS